MNATRTDAVALALLVVGLSGIGASVSLANGRERACEALGGHLVTVTQGATVQAPDGTLHLTRPGTWTGCVKR